VLAHIDEVIRDCKRRIPSEQLWKGYSLVETDEHEHLKIKVGAFTKYDTLDIGRRVHIVAENLGNMGIMTAKSIVLAD
jgi:hypothetical protein